MNRISGGHQHFDDILIWKQVQERLFDGQEQDYPWPSKCWSLNFKNWHQLNNIRGHQSYFTFSLNQIQEATNRIWIKTEEFWLIFFSQGHNLSKFSLIHLLHLNTWESLANLNKLQLFKSGQGHLRKDFLMAMNGTSSGHQSHFTLSLNQIHERLFGGHGHDFNKNRRVLIDFF